jgi:type I restriction enzyme S subunit
MKQGWEIKKLGDVCDVIGGGTPSKGNSKFYEGNILWATVRDMKGDFIKDTEHKITEDAVKNSSTNIIPKGNVVIATRVGLGKVCLIENDTAINQDLRGIIPKKMSVVTVGYLFQWLKSISYLIVEEGTGATVQGVKLPFIKDLPIPLPPLHEQQRIVSILDESFAAIAKAKSQCRAESSEC